MLGGIGSYLYRRSHLTIGGENIVLNQMEGKEYKVEIPRTTLAVKTYKEATDIMETLFGLGVRDVNIVAFRPNPDGSCC